MFQTTFLLSYLQIKKYNYLYNGVFNKLAFKMYSFEDLYYW
ncbi:hypothetical protein XSR1_260059 [Xenorhabdus szentirmaii DSM 16338]|uniref:Uncharacterized protein n=1 Tax=Xenorhabdus szentirmaii DSM 16338 TaxID=1427518 RepID=W1J0I0_9GAMM|nr:hypothetical protein XSR1_260059 [Xenorhabdus szentirmaii DSM 16338]